MNNKTQTTPLISIVCPIHNEAQGIAALHQALTQLFAQHSQYDFEVLCIDDGSSDNSLDQLIAVQAQDPRFRIIEFSRNFGKEAALSAGINLCKGDALIPMDADLQHPPSVIPLLIEKWQEGYDVVLAKRNNRHEESFLKRITAQWFYRLHNRMSSIQIPENVGDFRLINRSVINALKQLPEQQRFMKGLFAWVGFKTATIDYACQTRHSGSTKFSKWKLWNFALDGITSFSTAPLKIWTYIGILGAICSFSYGTFIILRTLMIGKDIPGFASLLVGILFLGSLQLMSIGMLGEYIGRIYMESKRRPTYLVRKIHEAE